MNETPSKRGHDGSYESLTDTDTDIETVRAALSLCAERRHDMNMRIAAWPDFRKTYRALSLLQARIGELERTQGGMEFTARLAQAEAALQEIADSHKTFNSAAADIRGQHCLDLERIASQALTSHRPTEADGK